MVRGAQNHLNFVPRSFEARRRWDLETQRRGGGRGFEGRRHYPENINASSFPAVPRGPIWQGRVSKGGSINSTYQGWTPRPAEKQAAPPRPANLTKSAGRSGAKLSADSIDIPFHYASKEERVGKSFHFSLFTYCDCLLHRNTFKK